MTIERSNYIQTIERTSAVLCFLYKRSFQDSLSVFLDSEMKTFVLILLILSLTEQKSCNKKENLRRCNQCRTILTEITGNKRVELFCFNFLFEESCCADVFASKSHRMF